MTNLSVAAARARAAPDPDQDVERDQHRLEEGVEEQQVLGGEDADRRAEQEEHQAEVGPRPVAARPDSVGDGRERDHDREAGEPEREVVQADLVGDAEVAEPDRRRVELQAGNGEVEAGDGGDPQPQLGEQGERGDGAGEPAAPGQEPEDEPGDHRHEDEPGREHLLHRQEDDEDDGEAGRDQQRIRGG